MSNRRVCGNDAMNILTWDGISGGWIQDEVMVEVLFRSNPIWRTGWRQSSIWKNSWWDWDDILPRDFLAPNSYAQLLHKVILSKYQKADYRNTFTVAVDFLEAIMQFKYFCKDMLKDACITLLKYHLDLWFSVPQHHLTQIPSEDHTISFPKCLLCNFSLNDLTEKYLEKVAANKIKWKNLLKLYSLFYVSESNIFWSIYNTYSTQAELFHVFSGKLKYIIESTVKMSHGKAIFFPISHINHMQLLSFN